MRLSSFRMPRWWQACWRRRYPLGVDGSIMATVVPKDPRQISATYHIRPMPCGCGYTIRRLGRTPEETPGHSATLGGAIRRARRHANTELVERDKLFKRVIADYDEWVRKFKEPHGR